MNEKLMEFINMSDTDFADDVKFYEEYVSELPLEDQAKFFEEFPEFLTAAEPDEQIKEQLKEIHDRIIEGCTRV